MHQNRQAARPLITRGPGYIRARNNLVLQLMIAKLESFGKTFLQCKEGHFLTG